MLLRDRQYRTYAVLLIGALVTGIVSYPEGVLADSKPYYTYKLSDSVRAEESTAVQRLGAVGSNAQFGAILTKGDFNGDTIDDLVVTSPYFSSEKGKRVGKVEVFLGKKEFAKAFSDPAVTADITFLGVTGGAELGTSFANGDINGDGIDDLIIGAPGERSVSIVYGRHSFSGFSGAVDLFPPRSDWTIRGRNEDEQFGFAVDSADMNGDMIDDVIVSAPFAPQSGMKRVGKVHVIFGKKGIPRNATHPLDLLSSDLLFTGNALDDRFGITLAHGDFDADKKTDLAIGSYMATNGTAKQAGTVAIVLGKKLDMKGMVRVSSESVRGDNLEGEKAENQEEEEKETKNGEDQDASRLDDALFTADSAFDWFGYSLSVGDLNRDMVDDLVIGSFPYLKNKRQGEVYVLWGEKGGQFLDVQLSRVFAPREESLIGGSVVVSDLNHDGAQDLIIGAPTGAPGSSVKQGRVYSLNFFPRNNQAWNFSKIPPDLTIEGRNVGDWFGSSLLAGDFDNDGNRDMVVGAPNTRYWPAASSPVTPGAVEYIPGPIFPHGEVSYTVAPPSEFVRRGSFMVQIMKAFRFDLKNKEFIDSCMAELEFCFYQFSSQTSFAGFSLAPILRLYPDVKPSDPYYAAVTIGTILGIVRGFADEPQTPFRPMKSISRIQALKILLTSTGMLPWKDYYELQKELADANNKASGKDLIVTQKTPYQDISARVPHMWWYPRYVNFAFLSGLISDTVFFQPDAPLTQKDFDIWTANIQAYLARHETSP